MFWADITKYIRSVLFKKELEGGNFKVKQAVESENGENISDFFDNSKSHINEMVEAMRVVLLCLLQALNLADTLQLYCLI